MRDLKLDKFFFKDIGGCHHSIARQIVGALENVLISWNTICLRKEYGGLEVRQYGEERGRLCEGGSSGSSWWREIVRIREGVGDSGGGWFRESVFKKVGDGSETFFWTDPWLDELHLKERFGRLFNLSVNQSSNVDEAQLPDKRQWKPDPFTGLSVCGAYQLLTSHQTVTSYSVTDLIWHCQVPLKVSIFAWRLLRDRLPTKTNLVSRGIITPKDHLCVSGCGDVESAQHLFLSCSFFGSIWPLVRSWIGFSSVDPQILSDHLNQFTFASGGLRVCRSFLQLIWLISV
ncbi:cysteine-rich receptor-like protein kinase [Trifolium medium]|uniref:Cysteine-rich receptor-like protein kinase n=1 Tax=Trifolium medium TaxID=97028 RepID=A0A392M406_9FABA|nr:cysteine-rich receptor-like protein kinase [Trifolium medium]